MPEDPYHTEFISWQVDHFSLLFLFFFSTNEEGGGQALSGKFHYFFLEPFPSSKRCREEKFFSLLNVLTVKVYNSNSLYTKMAGIMAAQLLVMPAVVY